MFDLSQLDFSKDAGYVTVVAQDAGTGLVLMVARADRDSIVETLATGELQYHARADGRWQRRPSGANRQRVVSLACDCDGDALLARVVPAGPTCHTGASSCFTGPEGDDARVTEQGSAVVADRGRRPGAARALAEVRRRSGRAHRRVCAGRRDRRHSRSHQPRVPDARRALRGRRIACRRSATARPARGTGVESTWCSHVRRVNRSRGDWRSVRHPGFLIRR